MNPHLVTSSGDKIALPTLEPPSTSQPSPVPSSTSPPASATPIQSLQFFEPSLIRLCPDQRKVSIQELDLDPHLQLLLEDVSEQPPRTIYTLSDLEIMSIPIPVTLNTNGQNLSTFFPSNDNRSLILKYVSPDEWQYSFWLGTQDGQIRREIASLDLTMSYYFASDYFVVLGDPPDDLLLHNWELVPFYTVNIITGDTEELPYLATHISWLDFFIKDGTQYFLGYQPFHNMPHQYYLYEYATGDAHPIFQWLDEIEGWYDLIPSIYDRQNGGFMSCVGRSYGFDISKDLDLEEMQQPAPYHEMMRAIVMPGEDSRDIHTAVYLRNNPIPIIRSHYDSVVPEKFYIFDYDELELTEYCLEGNFTGSIHISPNGRFLSIDIYPEPNVELGPVGSSAVLILNLLTGEYSILEGYSSNNWLIKTD